MFKKRFTKLLIPLLLLSCSGWLHAQVSIGATNYTTLKAAFDDINNGVKIGSIVVTITGNTTETASCVLNASGVGGAAYSDITISPSGGATRVIAGAIVGYLIDLSGATNVTIDGLATGGDNLTIRNTATGASGAVRFINDASSNFIKNTRLEGSSTTANNGVVLFGTGTISGNDNNVISNCQITAAGTSLPIIGVMSLGSATAGIENSSNTILNNNIFDFFNAGISSRGISLFTGNTGWTITGNRFYQTATRTFTTTGLTNIGILISTGSGYTVEKNTIGYSSSASSGTYTVASSGTITLQMVGISVATVAGVATSIQNNTITNISATSGGSNTIFLGISLSGTGSYDVGTITGNTIGSSTVTGAISCTTLSTSTTGSAVAGILSSATGTVQFKNNTIGGIVGIGSANSSCSIYGIQSSGGSNTFTFNTIGSNTVANSINSSSVNTTSQTVIGINITSGVTTPTNISDNIIANITQSSTGTGSTVRGLAYAATAKGTIERNIIHDISGASANSTQAGGGTAVQGMIVTGAALDGCLINNNTIYTIRGTNTGAVQVFVVGIGYSNPTDGVISNNKIYDIRTASTMTTATTPPLAGGILLRALLGNGVTITNNMISLGSGQTTNTEFVGIINSFNSTSVKAYHNSIYIGGTASSGALPSFAFLRGDNTTASAVATTVDLRNNIFVNTRTGGTGKHYAIGNNYGSSTSPSGGWATGASNYNVLNATAATVGYWSGDNTFAAWKTASSCDANSLSGTTVTFVDPTNGDLHLNMGLTDTPIESGGVSGLPLTTDYDNDTRPGPIGSVNGGGLTPDMGADEFDGVNTNLCAAPTQATALVFSSSPTSVSLSFTASVPAAHNYLIVKANSGFVPSTPVNQVNYTVGSNALGTGTEIVSISNATSVVVNGLTPGTSYDFFVFAYNNVGCAGGPVYNSIPLTGSATAATCPTLSATITIGITGADFKSITDCLNTMKACGGISTPTTIQLNSNYSSANEVFPIVINSTITGISATNPIVIKPATGSTPIITGSGAPALIQIQSSFVSIDGSNTVGGTSKDLTIENTSGAGGIVYIASTGAVPITDVALKNTILTGGSNSNLGVSVADVTSGTAAGLFNNITIQNNTIQRAWYGIFAIASVAAGNGTGLLIDNNNLNSSGSLAVRTGGIYLQGVEGATVSNNKIENLDQGTQEIDRGIWLATGTNKTVVSNNTINNLGFTQALAFAPIGINITVGTGTTSADITVSNNNITNLASDGTGHTIGINYSTSTFGVKILNNKITNIRNTNSGGWGAAGILLGSSGTDPNTALVANNFVSNIAAFGFAGRAVDDNGYGIVVSAGSGYNIYHNTVLLTNNQSATDGFPAAFHVTSGVTAGSAVNLQNNAFINRQTASTERYAISSGAANTVFGTINNNAYFSSGPNLSFIAAANQATLTALQTAFGGNTNSIVENPAFVSATDLHIPAGTNSKLESAGATIAAVTTDIDGQNRPGPTGSTNGGGTAPDIGADEFDGSVGGVKLSAKVFLNHVSGGLMSTYLPDLQGLTPASANFPLSDPYSAAPYSTNSRFTHVNNGAVQTSTTTVLTANDGTGNDIVDWVFLQLRTGVSGSTTVAYTQSALLQADGDIVKASDGVSPVEFPNAVPGSYYITVLHRNHLGFRTNATQALSATASSLNFTNNSVVLYGSNPTVTVGGVQVMVTGDANLDGAIDSNDKSLWNSTNGLSDDYQATSDFNLDGQVDSTDKSLWNTNNGLSEELD